VPFKAHFTVFTKSNNLGQYVYLIFFLTTLYEGISPNSMSFNYFVYISKFKKDKVRQKMFKQCLFKAPM